MKLTENLPELTQEPIHYVDSTPDEGYPLRILQAYRENCNSRWSDSASGENMNPLYDLMNKHQEQRAEILDRAIEKLQQIN